MKINIFPIVSSLHQKERISYQTKCLLDELFLLDKHEFNIVDIDELYNADLSLILIQSGGSEQLFLNNLSKLKEPFYLLTYGNNNSLAASLEILSYIKDNNLKGEVLHGTTSYLNSRINELLTTSNKNNELYRYGVIGKPSDWLIASNVNYNDVLNLLNVKLVDIDINEVIDLYNSDKDLYSDLVFKYDEVELNNALKLNHVLNYIKEKYCLDGLTIRCFDLLDSIKTTSCLSLALLNEKNIVATCEGDIPTMLSMHILNKVTNQVGFQANPSRIDKEKSEMVLAHCTLPLNMCKSFTLDSHFESGIGVAIRGKLKEQKVTIFKLSRNLKDYYVTTGTIIKNLDENNLCRTQILLKVDDNIEYFLNRPYGNHHVVVYGDFKKDIINYMKKN